MACTVALSSVLGSSLDQSWGVDVISMYCELLRAILLAQEPLDSGSVYEVRVTLAVANTLRRMLSEVADASRRAWALRYLTRLIQGIGTSQFLSHTGSSYLVSSVGLALVLIS